MKKFWLIAFVIVLIAVGGSSVYILRQKQSRTVISPEATVAVTPKAEELLTWVDPAGFTFRYPKGVEINKHDEDNENYAHVELIQKDYPGSVIIWAKDTTAADGEAWVKAEKRFNAATVFDTSLGGISGKKVLLTAPNKMVVSGVVDEGVVFYVEGAFQDSEYWTKAYDNITSSFTFSTGEKQSGSAEAGGGGEQSVDEEEVVE